jgi:hypothetical protein
MAAGKKQNVGKPVTADLTEEDQIIREKEKKKDAHGQSASAGTKVNPLVETEDGELREVYETNDQVMGIKPPTVFRKKKPEAEHMIPVFKKELLSQVTDILIAQFDDMREYAGKVGKHLIQNKKPGFGNSFLGLVKLIDHLEARVKKEGL